MKLSEKINITLALIFTLNSAIAADIIIDWKSVKNATKYEVTYVSDSGFSLTQTVSVNEYTIKNIEEGRKYIVTIKSLDDKNNASASSIPLFIQTERTNKAVYLKQPEPKFKIK